MCGLIARFGPPEIDAPPPGQRLAGAIDALRARGPDAAGAWRSRDGRATLGHARLALVGGAPGAQPCVTHGGDRAAVLNGDLYGWRESAAALTRSGLEHGGGDVGVLSALWRRDGDGFVAGLRGEFAVALVDVPARRLLAARDRFGVRPLLYAVVDGALWLGSTLDALFAVGVPTGLDVTSLGHALRHQYLPPGRTMVRGVRAVPPGGLLSASLDGGDRLRVEVRTALRVGFPRATANLERDDNHDDLDHAAALRRALDEAVVDRLDTDRRVAAIVSGGIDGAAVLASAVAAGARPPAFSVRFDAASHDESPQAGAIAAAFGVPFVAVDAGAEAMLAALPGAVRDAGALCINGHMAARRILARALRDAGLSVVLSGEGSDELGLGYPHLLAHAGVDADALRAAHARQRGVMLADRPGAHPSFEARLGFTPSFFEPKLAFGDRLLSLCTPDHERELRAHDPVDALLDELGDDLEAEAAGRHPAHAAAWLWSRLVLGGYILGAIADAQDGAFGLQGRPPFLDDRVLAVARATPVGAQVTSGRAQGKAVLREAMRGRLADEVCDRPKHPFLAPPLVAALTHGSDLRQRARERLGDGLPRVPCLSRDRALTWFDALDPASARAAGDDAVLWTLLSAACLADVLTEAK